MWDRFVAAGLGVVGISVDSVEQNATMVDKLLLPFPLLSDPEGTVIRAYSVWNPEEGGVAKPALFLVRPDRSIVWSYVGEDYADRPPDSSLFGVVEGV
jgi:peroxiredoxin